MYILYDTYVEQLPMYVKYESHMTHMAIGYYVYTLILRLEILKK